MKEYEIVFRYCNACAGAAHPQTSFEEAALYDPDDYVRKKHGEKFSKFSKTVNEKGQLSYRWDTGGVSYAYEFTEI